MLFLFAAKQLGYHAHAENPPLKITRLREALVELDKWNVILLLRELVTVFV